MNRDFSDIEDGIAIIGLSGRFAVAEDVRSYWSLVRSGANGVRRFGRDDALEGGANPADVASPDYVGAWGVLDSAMDFDARLFGYHDREATAMDPQHRIMIETCFDALEDCGIPASRRPMTGVFVGCGGNSYQLDVLGRTEEWTSRELDYDNRFGNLPGFLAMRIAYKLNLTGPAVNVQTACSTSLVAVHLAAQALLNRECDLAVAGGAHVKAPQMAGYIAEAGGILSPDGICRPFDAGANGTVFGNGAGAVVLQRLEDALAEGNRIDAVLLGTAINNDGDRKAGYTAPSVQGQADAIRACLDYAGVNARDVGYVEAHGTGTALGDPIEIRGLKAAFAPDTDEAGTCAVGSVKGSVGHMDAAAGVASLIKSVEIVRTGEIPPVSNLERIHEDIDLENSPFFLPQKTMRWEAREGRRIAGMNSFGFGGTNAHAIICNGPLPEPAPAVDGPVILPISAHQAEAVNDYAARLASALAAGDVSLADCASTLQWHREERPFRGAVAAATEDEAIERLEAASRNARFAVKASPAADPVFVFPGQGAQHPGMGQGLYHASDVFRETVDRCAELLDPLIGLDIRDLTVRARHDDDGARDRLKATEITQPALFTVSLAAARWWEAHGIVPKAMAGHSIGELVAAHIAGVFDLPAALRLVAGRGRLMGAMERGGMLSIPLPEDEVRAALPASLDLSVVNGPSMTVVSGPVPAIDEHLATLQAAGIDARRLETSHGFHSRMMDDAADAFRDLVAKETLSAPVLPVTSNVTGGFLTAEQATSPDYWSSHLRQPVRFADNLSTIFSNGPVTVIDLGPGSGFASLARSQAPTGAEGRIFATMPKAGSAAARTDDGSDALARAWAAGLSVDWASSGVERRPPARLPGYPFQRKTYAPKPRYDLRFGKPVQATPKRRVERWPLERSWQIAHFGARGPAAPGTWVLLADDQDEARALEAALHADHPGHEVSVRREVGGALEAGPGSLTIVDLRRAGSLPEDTTWNAVALVQWVQQAMSPSGARLVQVSRFAYAVSGETTLNPGHAAAAAVFRTAAEEDDRLSARCIDIGSDLLGDPEELRQLITAIRAETPYDLIALRSGMAFTESAADLRLPEEGGLAGLDRGVVVITGGTGGVGMAMAEALVERGQPRIALMARSSPGPEKLTEIEAWRLRGTDVTIVAADAGDRSSLLDGLAEVRRAAGPISGAIHAAGAVGGALVELMTRGQLAEVFAAKVGGALHLIDALTEDDPALLLFVSSVAAYGKDPGRGDYAAANRYLDALAEQCWLEGRNWVRSVAWDLWEGVGMGAGLDDLKLDPNKPVYRGMEKAAAQETFLRLLDHARPTTIVSTYDFDVVRKLAPLNLGGAAPEDSGTGERSRDTSGPGDEPPATLRGHWERALGVTGLQDTDDFFELGGDSLLALRLAGQLRRAFGRPVKPRMIIANPVFAAFEAVFAELPGESEGAGEDTGPPPAAEAARQEPPRLSPKGPVRLTSAQERMWFLEQLNPGTSLYNLTTCVRVSGAIDPDAFKRALVHVCKRHDAFHMAVEPIDGVPHFTIRPDTDLSVAFEDLSASPDREELVRAAIEEASAEAIDAAAPPLIRLRLYRMDAEDHRLVTSIHHLAWDDTSADIFLAELRLAYDAIASGSEPRLPALTRGFADVAEAQRNALTEKREEELKLFWSEALKDGLDALDLPTDHPRPAQQDFRGQRIYFEVESGWTRKVRGLAAELHVSPVAVWLALYMTLLYKLSGQGTQTVGMPSVQRDEFDAEGVIGLFLDPVTIRAEIDGAMAFRDLVTRVSASMMTAMEHQALPFDRLVAHLGPERDESRAPIFQTMFAFLNKPSSGDAASPYTLEAMPRDVGQSEYDLSIYVREENRADKPFSVWLEYAAALFEPSTIEHFGCMLNTLGAAALGSPATSVQDLDPLGAEERQRIIAMGTGPGRPDACEGTLHGLLDPAFARDGSRTAACVGDLTVSYSALDQEADRVAAALRAQGAGPGTRIALYLRRTEHLLPALLGILRAGAAYVPVDPGFPEARTRFMLEDSEALLVLTSKDLAGKLSPGAPRIVLVDDLPPVGGHRPQDTPDPGDLAYMIYTSGSTGQPKAVEIPHGAAANFLNSVVERPGLTGDDVLLAVTTVSFDIHVLELFLPLMVGARVVLATSEEAMDAKALASLIRRHGVTAMQATPATWRMLLEAEPEALDGLRVFCGGEALPQDLADAITARAAELWNLYGPTETTVWSSVARLGPGDPVDIGEPFLNTELHVIDRDQRLCPLGVTGELVIGGAGLARGYHRRPELTEDRFIRLQGFGGRRFYRTGDRARRGRSGRLEISGRLDHQVKLRGFRIELGEIEAALKAQDFVRDAVCMVREDRPGEPSLAAYLVPAGTFRADASFLREQLGDTLPGYMMPSHFVWLDALPLTPNRKVDRKALPAPDQPPPAAAEPPRPGLETTLAGIFCDILGIETVSRFDNFFDLGGHSLLSMRVVARVEAAAGIRLHPGELIQQSIAQIAKVHAAGDDPAPPEEPREPRSLVDKAFGFLRRVSPS